MPSFSKHTESVQVLKFCDGEGSAIWILLARIRAEQDSFQILWDVDFPQMISDGGCCSSNIQDHLLQSTMMTVDQKGFIVGSDGIACLAKLTF